MAHLRETYITILLEDFHGTLKLLLARCRLGWRFGSRVLEEGFGCRKPSRGLSRNGLAVGIGEHSIVDCKGDVNSAALKRGVSKS